MRSNYYSIVILFIVLLFSCGREEVELTTDQFPEDPIRLEAMLKDNHSDATKLLAYDKLYNAYLDEDVSKSLMYLDLIIDLSQKTNSSIDLGKSYFRKGYLFNREGEYIKSIPAYHTAAKYFKEAKDNIFLAHTFNNLGNAFFEAGRIDDAILFFENAKKLYEKEQEYQNLLEINTNLAVCYYTKSVPDLNKSKSYFENSLRYCNLVSSEQARYKNWVHNCLGIMYYKNHEYDKAIENYKQSISFDLPTTVNPKEKKAIAYMNIAESLSAVDKYDKASDWLAKAMLLDENLSEKDLVEMYNIKGGIFQKQGDHDNAIKSLNKAILVANKDIINPVLQRTLVLLENSYRALQISGFDVDDQNYAQLLEIYRIQSRLKDELTHKITSEAMQTALFMNTELTKATGQASFFEKQKSAIQRAAIIVAVFLLISLGLYYRKQKSYSVVKAHDDAVSKHLKKLHNHHAAFEEKMKNLKRKD